MLRLVNPKCDFFLSLPVKMLPVTGKFKGFKLDHFTRFYLKENGRIGLHKNN
jgi:hypothetical protein